MQPPQRPEQPPPPPPTHTHTDKRAKIQQQSHDAAVIAGTTETVATSATHRGRPRPPNPSQPHTMGVSQETRQGRRFPDFHTRDSCVCMWIPTPRNKH